MAKKKPEPKPDRHKGGHMVRIPDDVYEPTRELADENDRPLTREIRQALIAWLKANGKRPPG